MAVDGMDLVKPIIEKISEKMEKAIGHLEQEFERIRAGRATNHTLEPVRVDSYGALVPLSQVANVSIPEPRMIVVTPWDKSMLKEIEKGIINANLGLNPANDGTVVRVMIPALTEERRKDLCKVVKKEGENAKIAFRTARQDANAELEKLTKENSLSEDRRDNQKQFIQEMIEKFNKTADEKVKLKEKEVMTI